MFCNPYLQGQREGRGGKEMSSLCLIVPRFYKVENEQSTKNRLFQLCTMIHTVIPTPPILPG